MTSEILTCSPKNKGLVSFEEMEGAWQNGTRLGRLRRCAMDWRLTQTPYSSPHAPGL
jgi:hypothetical protein